MYRKELPNWDVCTFQHVYFVHLIAHFLYVLASADLTGASSGLGICRFFFLRSFLFFSSHQFSSVFLFRLSTFIVFCLYSVISAALSRTNVALCSRVLFVALWHWADRTSSQASRLP